jgi:hypothetical protein
MNDFVRQLLVKMAYTPAPLSGSLWNPQYSSVAPEQYARRVSNDIQTYGHLAPGSNEYNLTMKSQGFSPEYMQGITSAGQRLLSATGNPEFVKSYRARTTSLKDLYSDLDFTGKMIKDRIGKWNFLKYTLSNPVDSAAAYLKERSNPGQFGRTLEANIDMNSPLARAAKTKGFTTYLDSKIQGLSDKFGGGFGNNLGGALRFLLGLITKIPGYNTLANKLVDWDDLKALPATARVKANSYKFIAGSPYSQYRTIRTRCGSEVMTLWNRQ